MVSNYQKYDVIAALSKAEKYLNNYKKDGNNNQNKLEKNSVHSHNKIQKQK